MRYRVGEHVLDLRKFELRKDGRLVPAEPQVLSLLFLLLENRDRLVTKDELVEAITHLTFYAGWPNGMSAMTRLKAIVDEADQPESESD